MPTSTEASQGHSRETVDERPKEKESEEEKKTQTGKGREGKGREAVGIRMLQRGCLKDKNYRFWHSG